MINTNIASLRSALGRSTLIALGCAFSLILISGPALKAAEPATLQPLADAKAPSLPLTSAFEKVTGAENGPYVLKLTNTSKAALSVNAQVLLSVYSHSSTKARNLPEHVIEPGKVWSIADLAAQDKVVITAKGFAPLELTVH